MHRFVEAALRGRIRGVSCRMNLIAIGERASTGTILETYFRLNARSRPTRSKTTALTACLACAAEEALGRRDFLRQHPGPIHPDLRDRFIETVLGRGDRAFSMRGNCFMITGLTRTAPDDWKSSHAVIAAGERESRAGDPGRARRRSREPAPDIALTIPDTTSPDA